MNGSCAKLWLNYRKIYMFGKEIFFLFYRKIEMSLYKYYNCWLSMTNIGRQY